jgi:hypothetical protein
MWWIFKKGPPKEAFTIREAFEEKKNSREKLFAVLIAAGVTAEVITLLHTLKESGELRTQFGQLQQTNGWIWQTNFMLRLKTAELESNNLKLRSNVVALEERMKPRMIEIARPAERLRQFAGTKAVIIPAIGGDCLRTANQIGEILHSANWDIIRHSHREGSS